MQRTVECGALEHMHTLSCVRIPHLQKVRRNKGTPGSSSPSTVLGSVSLPHIDPVSAQCVLSTAHPECPVGGAAYNGLPIKLRAPHSTSVPH